MCKPLAVAASLNQIAAVTLGSLAFHQFSGAAKRFERPSDEEDVLHRWLHFWKSLFVDRRFVTTSSKRMLNRKFR